MKYGNLKMEHYLANIPYEISPLIIQEGEDPIENNRKILRSQLEHWGQINISVWRGQTTKQNVQCFHPSETKLCDNQR